MDHAHQSAVGLGVLQVLENGVEERVVVAGQVNAVRVFVEEPAVVLQGVVLHPEASRHVLQH